MINKDLHIERARILKGTLSVFIHYCNEFQKELYPKDFQTITTLNSLLICEMNLFNNPKTTKDDTR